jgi:hypothetical protein
MTTLQNSCPGYLLIFCIIRDIDKYDDDLIDNEYDDDLIYKGYDDGLIDNEYDDDLIYNGYDDGLIDNEYDDDLIDNEYDDGLIDNRYIFKKCVYFFSFQSNSLLNYDALNNWALKSYRN